MEQVLTILPLKKLRGKRKILRKSSTMLRKLGLGQKNGFPIKKACILAERMVTGRKVTQGIIAKSRVFEPVGRTFLTKFGKF